MKIIQIIFSLTLFLFCVMLAGCEQTPPNQPTAQQGIIDLTEWNFASDGSVELSGEWQYFTQEILSPSEFSDRDTSEHNDYFSVPGSWGHHEKFLEKIPAHGFATYRLQIKTQAIETPLVLITYGVMSAHRLWVNGKLRYEDGRVSTDVGAVIPGQLSAAPIYFSDFDLATNTIELVIQGSTSKHWAGGVNQPLKLGLEKQTIRQLEYQRWFVVLFASLLLFMGCFHLVLFCSRRQDRSTLFFSFFCLTWLVAVIAGAANRWLLSFIFPDLSFYASRNIEMISYYFSIPAALFFIRALFPDETHRLLAKVHFVLAIFFTLLRIFPPPIAGISEALAHIVTGFAICSFFVILVSALRNRRQSATLLAAGGIVFAICGSCDVLTQLGLMQTMYLTPVGLIIFVSCQACALALRFSKTFAATEALSFELRNKNLRLSRLDALKDEFLANTSHELRTPLSGIIGIAESMQAGATGVLPSTAKHNLDLVVASGKRLANLVNDILDFSRLNNNDLSLNLKPVDLESVVESVCENLSPLATGKGLSIINTLDASLPVVQADEDRLQQIFFNLIGNGIKFTPTGGLTITSEPSGNFLRVAITDTGIGIAQDKLEDIFLSFEQVDSAQTRNFGGTGLGLSISKSLIELHQGSLEVESELGSGTTFFLNIPLAEHSAVGTNLIHTAKCFKPTPLPTIKSAEPMAWMKMESVPADAATVMLVDDEPVNLQVAINQLGPEGFNVLTATNGSEALTLCEYKLPDLILLDVMMPGISGYDVCRQLRKNHPASTLPIIMVTARTRTDDLVIGFESGANDYLTKPFSRVELLVRVRFHLQVKMSYQALAENERLKNEVRLRNGMERELRLTQRRLAILLDTIDDALLATNESEEICFCNKVCSKMLGYDNDDLLGRPLKSILTDKALCLLEDVGAHSPEAADVQSTSYQDIEIKTPSGTDKSVNVERTLLLMEEENFAIYMIHQLTGDKKKGRELNGSNNQNNSLTLIKELNHNQIRLRGLEETLQSILPATSEQPSIILDELKGIDTALEGLSKMLQDPQTTEGRRQLAVTAMNLAIEYWAETTGNNKFDLARESGLWKVYTNQDGWERAQTLDKYLDINTLPDRPRWKLIMATCDFVLASSINPSALRNHLETDLSKIRVAQ